ncbi:hypothetical protein, partial [Mesorhizobium sp. M7A.F.Ca.AU.001.01.1.1]|uniref:hypothetical protein n=1 Tax=Mesorhizobium sp. M7A.F.Ca.AU.001.01.1.1 TaxID=2496675 RepID=UPI0019D43BE2
QRINSSLSAPYALRDARPGLPPRLAFAVPARLKGRAPRRLFSQSPARLLSIGLMAEALVDCFRFFCKPPH